MDISFGIVCGSNQQFLPQIIESIRQQKIPNYEIIIIGKNLNIISDDIKIINFDESREGWITKKKNLITDKAKYENIVYQHDYLSYSSGWYDTWKEFGDFNVGMNKLTNIDGTRYRDWSLFPNTGLIEQVKPILKYHEHCYEYLLPYTETKMSALMYISGAWWMAKKSVMQEFRLNESLVWGQGEDVEWSYRVRKKYNFSINPNAEVKLLKYNSVAFTPIQDDALNKVRNFLIHKSLYK